MPEKKTLFTLLGDYPVTKALRSGQVGSDLVDFTFAENKVANTGFKPLVREFKFDLSELAIVTYLQAKVYNKPYILLPAVIVARAQHHTLAYCPEHGAMTPKDLEGKRVGIRAYSVTTGVWVRGILKEQYGVNLDKVKWIAFDDPHLAEYVDPPEIARAPKGKETAQMLLDGELDAAILGDKLPDERIKHLIPDHEAKAKEWADKNGFPINHMLVIRSELSKTRPDLVKEVFRLFKASRDAAIKEGNKNAAELNYGVEANRKSLETIIGIAFDQKLIPRKFSVDELFDETTGALS